MIFVTVGTHEQPFNRLVECMDKWANVHDEEVIIQTGYSTFEPKHSEWKKLYPYKEMIAHVKNARIVITHGGPSSFIMPLQIGKIPIVVPRMKEYDEHVNNHQVDFSKAVATRQGNIIVVDSIDALETTIDKYDQLVAQMSKEISSNNAKFCDGFEKLVEGLVNK